MRNSFRNLWIVGLSLAAGCGQQPQVRQYDVAPEQDRVVTSEVLRSQFPVIPFRWTAPADWRSAPNDQFSVVAWAAGPVDATAEARITLSELPASAGVAAQVDRWRRQISLPALQGDEAMRDAEQLKLGDAAGSWVELKGAEETILGLLVQHEQDLWVFKCRSSSETAGQIRKSFRGFCETLRVERPGKS